MGCREHPGWKTETTTSFGGLCNQCAEQVKEAQARVSSHVEPKECFVTFKGNKEGWKSLSDAGTGCAHWVAHQLNIKGGYSNVCAAGFKIKVPDLISGARKIDPATEEVKLHDIWVNPGKDHCGLVISIRDKDGKKIYRIRHCSSGQGGVVENDHTSLWKGAGSFHRF